LLEKEGTMDFTPKRVGETEIFTVDFVDLLAQGETITTASWSITVLQGADPAPEAMLSGVASITGTKVSQMLTGGLPSVFYAPVCTVTTSTGQTLELPEYGNGALHVTP
jgi:hypothetical protein